MLDTRLTRACLSRTARKDLLIRAVSSLVPWIRAVDEIPPRAPMAQPGERSKAFVGDRILNCAVATELFRRASHPADPATLSKDLCSIISNANLASHVKTILPDFTVNQNSVREIGNIVEAAVFDVHLKLPSAVPCLAKFLVDQSRGFPVSNYKGTKGTLLRLGGRIASCERTGGSDHCPVFTAIAEVEMRGQTLRASAVGSSKKQAEMTAAAAVLQRDGR